MKKWIIPLAIGALWWGYLEKEDEPGPSLTSAKREVLRPASKETRLPASSGSVLSASKTPSIQAKTAVASGHPVAVNPPDPIQVLKRLQECLQSELCDYPQTDPQSYALGVGQDLKMALQSLAAAVSNDPKLANEAGESARDFIKSFDGHIQEGALAVFAKLPTSAENLQSILEGLRGNPADPLILEQAGRELSRYLNSPSEPLVHQFFSETLSQGALFTSQKAGVVVKDVLTPQSASRYRQLLSGLRSDSTTAKNLRITLDEYDRLRDGG